MERCSYKKEACSAKGQKIKGIWVCDNHLVAYEVEQQRATHPDQSADAQATVEALQARVRELEARQHFGACAKCLTNAWRICKEDAPNAVEMKCSDGSTWWKCDYCAMTARLAETYRMAQDSENERLDLRAEVEALQRERDEWREATKVICGHCCEPMAIPSKAILQSQLSAHQGLVETIKCELFDRYDGAPDSPTRWMGPLIRDIEIAQALPATPTERGEGHSGDDTDMVQNEGGDGE